MNGSYFQNPTFPGATENENGTTSSTPQSFMTPPGNVSFNPLNDGEQSYIENILRLNKGKTARIYVSYPDSIEWKDKIYDGVIEQAGRDHLILSDPATGKWYLIRMIYLNYVEFDEKINYVPFSTSTF